MEPADPLRVAANRRKDLLQTFVVLGIVLTPAWLTPAWFARPWLVATLVLAGPALVLSWVHAPWVPTPRAELARILAALDLAPGQTFCDLGCGDGRLLVWVREATGATCVGIEAAPLLVGIARLRAAWAGRGGITVRLGDLYAADLGGMDRVYVWGTAYSVGTPRFREFLQRAVRPGARVVSYQTPLEGLVPSAVDTAGQRPIFTYLWGGLASGPTATEPA